MCLVVLVDAAGAVIDVTLGRAILVRSVSRWVASCDIGIGSIRLLSRRRDHYSLLFVNDGLRSRFLNNDHRGRWRAVSGIAVAPVRANDGTDDGKQD